MFTHSCSAFTTLVAEPCNESVDFFFIDTTTFVNEYWDPTSKNTFDWRGLAPRENLLKSQLQVNILSL